MDDYKQIILNLNNTFLLFILGTIVTVLIIKKVMYSSKNKKLKIIYKTWLNLTNVKLSYLV